MAKPKRRSPNSVPEAQPDEAAPAAPMDVLNATGPGDKTIIIDTKTGHITTKNEDGSISVKPIGGERKKPERKGFDDNLAEFLEESILQKVANRLLQGIEEDIRSRRGWEETAEKGAEIIGVKLENASIDVDTDGTISRVRHTGLLRACITSWSNARAELLPVGGPVKVRDDETTEDDSLSALAGLGHNGGPPLAPEVPPLPTGPGIAPVAAPGAQPAPPGLGLNGAAPPPAVPPAGASEKRNQLAQDFENDFNHYLTVVDKDYYPDFSRMLMSRGLLGCQFRKVYHDPVLRRPVSRWVKGVDLIVSNEATSLTGAARITERIPMRQAMVKRLQKIKHWRQIALVTPTTTTTGLEKAIAESEGIDRNTTVLTEDHLHTIYESYADCDEGDLANDESGKAPGWPLPYRVTIDKDSQRIVEIRRNWKKGDESYIKRRRYVKYGHVPGLGFYDWGFVHMIGNPQRAATMIERALIDVGMLTSFPGGVMAKSPGSRQRTTQIRPSMGQFTVIDTGGLPISDFVMPWPYKEPSAVLAAMGQDLNQQMNQVAGVVDMPVGEGMANVPVGTIMAYIEAVTKVPSAVHKDDHIAQQEEFELLRELFAEDPESLIKFARKPKRKQYAMQEILDQDLVPAADPNIPSQVHRLMQTNMLVQVSGLPQFAGIPNQRAVYERAIRTIGASNTGEYTNAPAPAAAAPPDPRIVAAGIKAKSQADTDAAKAAEAERARHAEAAKAAQTSADKAADRESEDFRAAVKAHGEGQKAHADVVKHGITEHMDHVQHGAEMEHAATELAVTHAHKLIDGQQAAQDRAHEADQAARDQAAAAAGEGIAPGGQAGA